MQQHICPWWIAYTFDNPLRRLFHNPEKLFANLIGKGMTVADIGCGMGYFSLAMARLVQETGKVIAVDVQPQMLTRVNRRAKKAGLSPIIEARLCQPGLIRIPEKTDFALAFWMVHETPDIELFFSQIHDLLKPGGALLVTEPKRHVTTAQFNEELALAHRQGFKVKARPVVALSLAALLRVD